MKHDSTTVMVRRRKKKKKKEAIKKGGDGRRIKREPREKRLMAQTTARHMTK